MEHGHVVVVGSGDYGRALVYCLTRGGYTVTVASRNPDRVRDRVKEAGGTVDYIEEALEKCRIVFLAIPHDQIHNLDPEIFAGKIVIDVSNRLQRKIDIDYGSLGERLQDHLKRSQVVKGFNTVSAYALWNGMLQGSKEVPVCSDYTDATATVMSLVRDLGFSPLDHGKLLNAGAIEDLPYTFYPEWKFPVIFSTIVFVVSFIITLLRKQICNQFEEMDNGADWSWESFKTVGTFNLHITFSMVSLIDLAMCYFPGVLAGYIQLTRGTKYSQFPRWLDNWLKERKQLGLLSFFFAFCHAFLVLIKLIWKGVNNPEWNDFTCYGTGVIALGLMAVVAVTSLPSVSGVLSWKEFSFVQRYFGWICLVFSVLHVIFYSWERLLEDKFKCKFIATEAQIVIVLPLLTILLKLPLLIPCVDSYLMKIRRGYERGSTIKA